MILNAPPAYSQQIWQQLLNVIRDGLRSAFMKGQDVDLARGERLILHSPTGARWFLGVSTSGALSVAGDPNALKFNVGRNSVFLGII